MKQLLSPAAHIALTP